ncbi:M20/M25/M40 family metallo-hydrolase [Streptomyces sp. IB2014 016-6]|uniref:M20/M25/M40 family metallo-hydrolase n=1 Tax=Streptomyces sp. IB2014 016-6 TaxID=2517818 RepID=UPI0011CB1392|nr:M20/M25/M40 family metallo-hydrolase [Streptomyces sp. IB2014 016-6]TXL85298.1 M20 family peptidase [Streptomyces sp. IB2014 016-6]
MSAPAPTPAPRSPEGPVLSRISSWCRTPEHQDGYLTDLRRLVEQESPSDEKKLLDATADLLLELLAERLGEPSRTVRHRHPELGDVVEAEYDGTVTGAVVTVVGHYDTVWPAGTITDWPFTVTGTTASGPGVFDMKAGLAQGIWALRALRDLGLPRPTVRFVFNGDEETGSVVSRPLVERATEDAVATLVLEPGGEWGVKAGRKGVGIFNLTANGLEAHAGLDPAKGASAVHGLADVIGDLVAAADPERGTTVNVGRISGGTARNVIAGEATCLVDVRVSTQDEIERIDGVLAGLATGDPRVTLTVTGGWNRPPMRPGAAGRRLFALADSVATHIRGPLAELFVGGGSDANFIAALGRPVLCGMGATGDGAHARHEHVTVADLPDRVALTAGTLLGLAAEPLSGS